MMKHIQLLSLVFLFFCSTATAQQLHYAIDEAHSQIKFIGLLGDMMEVEGKFGMFWGDVFFDPEQPEKLSVSLVIDPTSLDTDNEWRDKHLQDEDFLNTESHDIIVFKSTEVNPQTSLTGSLLLKGEQRTVTLNYQKTLGPVDDPWGNRRITFSGDFTFSRSDFDLGPSEGFWGKGIGDEVTISFTISATRRNLDRMGVFKNESVAAMWDNIVEGNMATVMDDIDDRLSEADEETKKRIASTIDLLAKRAKQYELEEPYKQLLAKNRVAFPELDWVHSHQALGFWESGQYEKATEAAQNALRINAKNTLAMELLK